MTTAQQTLKGPFTPPPCSLHLDPFLNEDHANAVNPAPEPPRCRFLSSDKRQCRMLRADHHPDFCLYHAARQEEIFALLPEREFDLAPELVALAADLTTATGVNRALGQVFRLLAKHHITRKDAVAFGYIAQLLLQTVPGVRSEAISAFGHQAWASHLQSSLTSQPDPPPAEAAAPAEAVRSATPLSSSSRASSDSEARLPRSGSPCGGSLSARPIPERASPPETNSASLADSAAANASATSAFSNPNYADLLNRSVDLLDGKFDASPESQRQAQRLLDDLEQIAPRRITAAECALPQTRSQLAQNVHLQNH
jgi:hypothetical protein